MHIKIPCFHNKSIYTLFLTSFVFFSSVCHGHIRDYQTTRLKSTGGAGAGSFLVDESLFLNPSSLGFFDIGSLYYQSNSVDYSSDSSLAPFSNDAKDKAIIASDSKGQNAGAFGYISQSRGDQERKTFAVSLARPIGEKSSFGVSYRRVIDRQYDDPTNQLAISSERYNKFSIGVTHALSEYFSFGVVINDPTKARDNTYATIGFQYFFHDYIVVIGDMSGDYTQNISDTAIYRGAIQVKFLNDFFLRGGGFKDNKRDESGTGVGIGWVGPKLVFELAVQNIDVKESTVLSRPKQEIKETSFSIAYKF